MNSTADRLLTVSRRLFAERGYEGTSIRMITARARANLGAVTYHFGSKERLYHVVLSQLAEPLAAELGAAIASPGSPLERIAAVIRAYFEYFARCPELPAIMVHEMALGHALPPPIRQALDQIVPALFRLVEEGQEAGQVRSGNPVPYALSIVAQPFYFSIVRRAMPELAGPAAGTPEFRTMLIQHAVEFACRGLAPDGEQQP